MLFPDCVKAVLSHPSPEPPIKILFTDCINPVLSHPSPEPPIKILFTDCINPVLSHPSPEPPIKILFTDCVNAVLSHPSPEPPIKMLFTDCINPVLSYPSPVPPTKMLFAACVKFVLSKPSLLPPLKIALLGGCANRVDKVTENSSIIKIFFIITCLKVKKFTGLFLLTEYLNKENYCRFHRSSLLKPFLMFVHQLTHCCKQLHATHMNQNLSNWLYQYSRLH